MDARVSINEKSAEVGIPSCTRKNEQLKYSKKWGNCQMTERIYEESGYESFHGNEFVSDEDAYGYAFERCTNGTEEEIKEFQKMLVDWFFSGNWIRRERNVEDEE